MLRWLFIPEFGFDFTLSSLVSLDASPKFARGHLKMLTEDAGHVRLAGKAACHRNVDDVRIFMPEKFLGTPEA